ncbi:DUF1073 domain-containing protein [Psychrobacter cibarius]|nr:DUF1073 domain-containing protein [Psychrobacter cibarius]
MLNKLFNIADSTLVNLVSKLGTSRDKASHDQFAWHVPKSVFELDNIYKSNATASKIVDKPVQDMFRQGYYFGGIAGKELKKLSNEFDRLKLDVHLSRAMRLSRLHGKSYILLATADNMELNEPLNKVNELSYITTLSVTQLAAGSEMRPASEAGGCYDKPVYYRLQKGIGSTGTEIIHHSRIIEIKWADGDSVLQPLIDAELIRFASVNENTASLVHEAKIDIIKTPDLANQIQDNADSILKRFALVGMLKGNNGTVLLDKEEDFQSKSYNFSGLPDLMQEFAIQLSGAADIPYTILFGRSPSGLSATGEHDLKNYYDTVGSYQRDYLRPVLQELLNMISGYLLPNEDITLIFSPLWQIDEKTLSEIEKNNAERDVKYLENGIITEAHVAKQLVEQDTYTVIDDEHIALLSGLNFDMGLDDVKPVKAVNTAAE